MLLRATVESRREQKVWEPWPLSLPFEGGGTNIQGSHGHREGTTVQQFRSRADIPFDLCLPVHILLAFSASSAAISSQLPCLLFVFQPIASTFLSNCSFELYHEFAHHPTKWQLSASILLELCAPAFAVGLFILLCDVSLMSWELFLSVPVNLLQLSVLSTFLLPWFSSIPLLLGFTVIYLQKSPNQHLHFWFALEHEAPNMNTEQTQDHAGCQVPKKLWQHWKQLANCGAYKHAHGSSQLFTLWANVLN